MRSIREPCVRFYKHLFRQRQRGKGLEGFSYLDSHHLLSLDGTGYFSSSKAPCAQCGEKHHHNGSVTDYHQMLGAVLVNPDCPEVIPLAPEPILKQDAAKKNDCERNAAKRLLMDLRREHPRLKLIVIEDALASNAPHIRLLKELDVRFLLGAKPADHKFLFDWVAHTPSTAEHAVTDEQGIQHRSGASPLFAKPEMGSVRFWVRKIRRRPWPSAARVRPASVPARTPRGARTPAMSGARVAAA